MLPPCKHLTKRFHEATPSQNSHSPLQQLAAHNRLNHTSALHRLLLSPTPKEPTDSMLQRKQLAQVDQGSQIKMIQVKEMMQDNDLKNLKSKDKGSKSRSQSMDEQSHYKQDKTITRQSINVKRHIFNVIGDTEKFEERDLNIGGDCEAVAWPAEGTFMLVTPDAFSTMVANLFKDERLERVEVNVYSFVEISFRSPGSSISMSLTCFFSSLISPDNLMIFKGSFFSSVRKQLANSCEAKRLDSLGFKEVTKSSVSWVMSGYEGLAFIEETSALAFAFAYSSSSF
ncbi:hypothetical protein Tco_1237637 [Tanacetum coccineum]